MAPAVGAVIAISVPNRGQRRAPLLAGADAVAFVDVDDTVAETFGYAKQGAGCSHTGVKGLNSRR